MRARTATLAAVLLAAVAVALAIAFGGKEGSKAEEAEARVPGEGHLRYSLNRVPDCVDPVKLLHAINSPLGKGRLVGASFDYPDHAGPNGVLAERIGSAGSYSPGTRPEIYYHDLPPGFYRLIVNLAQNNGSPAQFHDVTNFQILPRPGHGPKPCTEGKVPSAKAAARLE
jgi:hypothetical protein